MASETAGEKGGGSVTGFLIALVMTITIGAGVGFGFMQLSSALQPAAQAAVQSAASADGSKPHGDGAKPGKEPAAALGASTGNVTVLPLDPIIVNLARSEGRGLRLEAHVIFATAPKDDQSVQLKIMAEDVAAYLRSVTVDQLDTASGFDFLREDLSELVQLRSKGAARGVIIKGLMIE